MAQQPENTNALIKKGELYFLQGNLKLAEKYFINAIQLSPDLVEAHNNLGVVYWHRGSLKKSLVYFKKALTLDPTNQDAINNLQQISALLKEGVQANNSQKAQTDFCPPPPEQRTVTGLKVLAGLFIPDPSPGKSQGGLYLVDLKNNDWEQVIDLNNIPMDQGKKGPDRTISGITLHKDQVCLVAGDELFIYDKDFKPIETHQSPYLKNANGLSASGNRLFLTSTGFDSVLVFDFLSKRFSEGYHIRYNKTAHSINLLPFNPESEKGPSQENRIDLNTVYIHGNRLYFSCGKLDRFFCVQENGAMHSAAKIPLGTHTVRPYKNGYLIIDANKPAVNHLDFKGNTIESFSLPPLVKTDYNTTPISNFSGALCVTDDDSIIAFASPSTLIKYRSGDNEPAITVSPNIETASSIDALAAWTL